jgi:hypothetical protein
VERHPVMKSAPQMRVSKQDNTLPIFSYFHTCSPLRRLG